MASTSSRQPQLFPALLGAAALALPHAELSAADLFTGGHGDIGVGYEDGALIPHWHLHGGALVNGVPLPGDAEYAPGGLIAHVPDPSLSRPAGSPWDFLGTPAGSPLWLLPQSEDPTKPFLGIASEELDPAEWNSLRLSLVGLSGPAGGEFSLWQADVLGTPVVRMATSNGVDAADGFDLTVGGHGHHNYGFTQPGLYDLTLRWDGVHQTDGPVSAAATYRFTVQQVPERVRLLTSHVDIAVRPQPEEETHQLTLVVRDDDQGHTYLSNEVALVAVEAARLTLPPGTIFGEAGAPLWVLPQSLNPDVLYVGLSGAALPGGTFVGDLELRLIEVRGPGHFFLWQAGAFGEFDLRMNTADGISAEDQVAVPSGAHAHYNWGFTTNGVYEVVLQAFGQRAGIPTNDFSLPTPWRFEVEPLPPEPAKPFAQWQQQQWPGVADTAVIGPDADPDGDQVVNAVEYALGMDPQTPGRDGLPIAAAAGDPPRATLQLSTPVTATDVTFTGWRAHALPASTWERLGDPLVAPGLPGDTERVLVFDGGLVTAGKPVYLRLDVRLD